MQLLRAERQRRLCEDIISTQRRIIEEGKVELPDELKYLYALYQQEIHASSFVPNVSTPRELYDGKLPAIYSRRYLYIFNNLQDSRLIVIIFNKTV